jgi:hypothetical protein
MGISCSSAEVAGGPHDIFKTKTPSSIAASIFSGWQGEGQALAHENTG